MTLGSSRLADRKTKEVSNHPDHDGQLQHFNRQVLDLQAAGLPVISADTKKNELVGDYKNGGSDYRPVGCPAKVCGARLHRPRRRQGGAVRRL